MESTVTDKLSDFGYKSTLNAVSLGTRYEQYESLFFSPRISISDESLETTSDASAAYKKQEGSYFDTTFGYGLSLDKRNQKFKTSDGFRSYYSINVPIISDTNTLTNNFNYKKNNETNYRDSPNFYAHNYPLIFKKNNWELMWSKKKYINFFINDHWVYCGFNTKNEERVT